MNAALALVAVTLHMVVVCIFVPYQRLSDNVRSIILSIIEIVAVVFTVLPRREYADEHRYFAVTIIAAIVAVCFAAIVVLFHSLYLIYVIMHSEWTPPPPPSPEDAAKAHTPTAPTSRNSSTALSTKSSVSKVKPGYVPPGDIRLDTVNTADIVGLPDGQSASRSYAATLRKKTSPGSMDSLQSPAPKLSSVWEQQEYLKIVNDIKVTKDVQLPLPSRGSMKLLHSNRNGTDYEGHPLRLNDGESTVQSEHVSLEHFAAPPDIWRVRSPGSREGVDDRPSGEHGRHSGGGGAQRKADRTVSQVYGCDEDGNVGPAWAHAHPIVSSGAATAASIVLASPEMLEHERMLRKYDGALNRGSSQPSMESSPGATSINHAYAPANDSSNSHGGVHGRAAAQGGPSVATTRQADAIMGASPRHFMGRHGAEHAMDVATHLDYVYSTTPSSYSAASVQGGGKQSKTVFI